MRCPHFHDPQYAEKKQAAFGRVQRGINHLMIEKESEEADDVMVLFDPTKSLDTEYVLLHRV